MGKNKDWSPKRPAHVIFWREEEKCLEQVNPEFSKMRRRRKELGELWVQGNPENVHLMQTRTRSGRRNGNPMCCTPGLGEEEKEEEEEEEEEFP